MDFYDAVYWLAKDQGISIERLSIKLRRSSIYIGGAKIRGSLPKVDNARMILNALDYELCAIPKGRVPEDAIIID